MNTIILEKLREIEQTENVKILLAVESGSRAWGFASPDSDYDVRFIYVRTMNEYLRLEKVRDVIELPINDNLDINGWDLNKTLRLLYKSNPTLFEWFNSPIVYVKTDFAEKIKSVANQCFMEKKALCHYISMAQGNYREYIKRDYVIVKKYFYVLRPVLACKWILDKRTPPPMLFSELVKNQLEKSFVPDVNMLLDLKMNSPETHEIRRIDSLNEYLDFNIDMIKKEVSEMPDSTEYGYNDLNKLFLEVIKEIR